ncbi:MAG: hypothetical protein IKK66_01980 [Ruminococcus sp.]|nr:hypothetical protein [Ruminococcus sp.]
MADDKKKGAKAYETFYYIAMTIAVAAFAFFGYMKLSDTEIFIFDRLIGCYTICFTVVLVFTVIRIITMYRKKNKIDYQTGLMIASGVVAATCFINSFAEDCAKSKTKDVLVVNEATNVFLCERIEDNGHTKIDVYRVRDRMAKKIGEIDERPFSTRCVAEDTYEYVVSDNGDIITITCEYGKYYDEKVALKPEYDKGYLTFSFALD